MSKRNESHYDPSVIDASISPLNLDSYQALAAKTDKSGRSGREGVGFLLLGLFGEVGSPLSALKKKQRDKDAFTAYNEAVLEEFGDVLWYFANAALRERITLSTLAAQLPSLSNTSTYSGRPLPKTFADLQSGSSVLNGPTDGISFEHLLLVLAGRVGKVVDEFSSENLRGDQKEITRILGEILSALVAAADDVRVDLHQAAKLNIQKVLDRWPITLDWGALFDEDYPVEEQLPRQMAISFTERSVAGRSYVVQQLNGVNIGDRLTDNREEPDDYRFHDVFHLAFAAVLGWSPVMRALLKLKRKSRPDIDENQDGARAAITEEGIATWIFNQGLRNGHFQGANSLDYSLLKAVHELVRGYEVDRRPLWQWERAILEGFRIFRQLSSHRGGIVRLDLSLRTIEYGSAE
jgi:NTP pyrophosphatase (non-canonical NTP hydrolase)